MQEAGLLLSFALSILVFYFSRSKPSCNSLKTLHARDGCWNNWRLVPIFAVRTNWAMLLFRSFSSLVKSFELNNNNWYWKETQRESRSKSTLILNVNYAFVINHRLWFLGQYAENLIRLSLQLDFIFISTSRHNIRTPWKNKVGFVLGGRESCLNILEKTDRPPEELFHIQELRTKDR